MSPRDHISHGLLRSLDEQIFETTEEGLQSFENAKGPDIESGPSQGGGVVRGQVFPAGVPEGSIPSASISDPSGQPFPEVNRMDTKVDSRQLWPTDPEDRRKAGGT